MTSKSYTKRSKAGNVQPTTSLGLSGSVIDYDKKFSERQCDSCSADVFVAIHPGANPPKSLTCANLACRKVFNE